MKRILLTAIIILLGQNATVLPATTLTVGKVYVPHNISELQEIIANNPKVVIDFKATWCGPCKRMEPILDALAKEFTDILFIAVDVDLFGDISSIHNVRSMPTFVFFRNGKKIATATGAQTPKEFKALLTKYF